ncbi:hypothetical protein RN001_007559 [Aquatica leii]|uniref:Uncharacterized protein n=1 Tax=Aquatica leii TaxID=1421715 RepID=A0AAN7P9P2_9COLE|nr:hypothetical protein RN001_007559 [Aquatica leii]
MLLASGDEVPFIIICQSFIDREKWKSRKSFFFETLAFCLNLQNFWRFPREAYIRGQGAFVYLYIFFMMFIGSVILFFEVALGQYSSRGPCKVFSLCPIFEGISVSMALYCMILSIYYNILNVHSFLYFFASFNKTIEYSNCNSIPSSHCVKGSSNVSLSPEYAYFTYRVIADVKDFSRSHDTSLPSLRNATILFFLWILVCIMILKSVRIVRWPAITYCPIPFLAFTVTIISALTVEGASNGLRAMFVCKMEDFKQAKVWFYSLEQALVSLGLGIGPIITLGSYAKFQTPTDRDSLYITIATMISALMAGAIAFCTAGILASEQNESVETVLKYNGVYSTDFCVHVLLSQLITRLPNTLAHVISLILFFTLFLAGWYSLISLTESVIVSCYTFFPICHKYKIATNLGVCMTCCIFGMLIASPVGYKILLCIDHILISSAVVIVIMCELCAVIYIYGIHEFSDDIAFMLGFSPNTYIQFVWLFSPFVIMIIYCRMVYFISLLSLTLYEKFLTQLSITVSILPIAIVAVKNCFEFYKAGDITRVFVSRDATGEISDIDLQSASVPWFRKFRESVVTSSPTPGPSTRNIN